MRQHIVYHFAFCDTVKHLFFLNNIWNILDLISKCRMAQWTRSVQYALDRLISLESYIVFIIIICLLYRTRVSVCNMNLFMICMKRREYFTTFEAIALLTHQSRPSQNERCTKTHMVADWKRSKYIAKRGILFYCCNGRGCEHCDQFHTIYGLFLHLTQKLNRPAIYRVHDACIILDEKKIYCIAKSHRGVYTMKIILKKKHRDVLFYSFFFFCSDGILLVGRRCCVCAAWTWQWFDKSVEVGWAVLDHFNKIRYRNYICLYSVHILSNISILQARELQ